MLRKQLSLAILFVALSCPVLFGQSSSSHFLLLTNMTSATLPSVNVLTYALLDGFTSRGDGFGGWFYAITNASPLASDGLNVFRITNSLGQSGNWIRGDLRNTGTNGPVGPVGGIDVTGTLPNNLSVVGINGAVLGVTTATSGNILIATNSTWKSTAVTGDWTISNGGVATLASVVSAGTGTKITANAKGLVTTIASAVLASSDFANQGTTTTVLHGNASGNPSWSAVSLTADVSGDLPFSNIAQIANNSLLGNFTGGTADVQVLTSITSANLAQVISNETGTGVLVFGTDPIFTNTATVLRTTDGTSLIVSNSFATFSGIAEVVHVARAATTGYDFLAGYANGVGQFEINGTGAFIQSGTGVNSFSGVHIGGTSDPGDNNFLVDGTAEITGLITATSSLTYPGATASRATVWDASSKLISSVTTLAELAFVSGVTSSIQTQFAGKTFVPKYVSGDPNALGTVGDGDGQMCMDTATGNRWFYYTATTSWLP